MQNPKTSATTKGLCSAAMIKLQHGTDVSGGLNPHKSGGCNWRRELVTASGGHLWCRSLVADSGAHGDTNG